ncbi:MAG: hypothetical protein JW881_21305 [Spirochaetales bacterium]|nr:hypothetical protein [Spirochaetales bacterium]
MPDNGMLDNRKTIDEFSDNLKTIKELLFEVKIKTIYARWAFYVWGGLLIAGGIVHFLVERYASLAPMEYFYYIWVPVIILAGLFELISFIQNMTRHSLNILSPPLVKYYIGLVLFLFIAILPCLVFLKLEVYRDIPVFLTAAAGGFYILYALATHINYLVPAAILTASSFIFYFSGLPTHLLVLVCSICAGGGWIGGGFICYLLQKKDAADE